MVNGFSLKCLGLGDLDSAGSEQLVGAPGRCQRRVGAMPLHEEIRRAPNFGVIDHLTITEPAQL